MLKTKLTKIASFFMSAVMMMSMLAALPVKTTTVDAATFNDINASNVFLRQEGKSTCTLTSSAMMLRRVAMMRGDSNWNNITEGSLRSTAWKEGAGLKWDFTYSNIRVQYSAMTPSENTLKSLLNEHPEGIVAYNRDAPHAVLLTDYTNGNFYCADPLKDGRILLTNSYKVRVSNITGYWYVSSPKVALSTLPSTPSTSSPKLCVDRVTTGPGTITISGWAYDPDNKDASLIIRAYFEDNTCVGETIAENDDDDQLKAVIGSASRYKHRFAATFNTNQTGNHRLNIAACDAGNDPAAWSGHDINIPFKPAASPIGKLQYYHGGVNKAAISGWAYDPDDASKPIEVHLYIDGKAGEGGICIGTTKTGIDWEYGTKNGFYLSATANVSTGMHKIYVYAINLEGTGGNPYTIIGETTVFVYKSENLGDNFDAMIKNPGSGKYAIASAENNNVCLYDTSGNCYATQRVWNFARQSDNSYRITSYYNSKCLDVAGAKDANETNIGTYQSNNSSAQRWFIVKNGNGYRLMPACSNTRSLDIAGGDKNTANGTNIQLWDNNETNAQIFSINKISDTTKPTVSKIEISNVTVNGYKVKVTASDNIGIKQVKVPTWTSEGGQDDLKWHVATQTSQNTWEYNVKVSDHLNRRGIYYTDVYAYDFSGNETKCSGSTNQRSTVKVGLYDLTINPNGGTMKDESGKNTTNAVKITKNQLIYNGSNYYSLTWTIPTRTGYTFTGFYTAATGGTKVYGTDGKCVNEGKYFKNNNYMNAGNLTVYAQWKANTYKVSFNANGGTCDKASINVTRDAKYGTLPTPTKVGYTFTGWFTAATGGTNILADTKVVLTANQTLYAQWKAKSVSVKLFRNNNASDTSSVTETFTYGVSNQKFGYKTDGTGRYSPMNNANVGFGEWTRKGYELLGWNTDKSSKSAQYSTYSGVTNNWINKNSPSVNLYAVWKACTYKVTFDANGGICDKASINVTHDAKYGTLPTPKKTGYTFNGWYTAVSGGSKVDANTEVTITANQTLYAQWKEEPIITTVVTTEDYTDTTTETTVVTTTIIQTLESQWEEEPVITTAVTTEDCTDTTTETTVVITTVTTVETTNEKPITAGDINGDGTVSIADMVILQKYLVNLHTMTSEQWQMSDMNNDGSINVFDVIVLRRKLLAQISQNIKTEAADNEYWVVYREGYRNGRLEMAKVSVPEGAKVTWDMGLSVDKQNGDVTQYYYDGTEWIEFGNYNVISDYSVEVIASNVDIYDIDEQIIFSKTNDKLSDVDMTYISLAY